MTDIQKVFKQFEVLDMLSMITAEARNSKIKESVWCVATYVVAHGDSLAAFDKIVAMEIKSIANEMSGMIPECKSSTKVLGVSCGSKFTICGHLARVVESDWSMFGHSYLGDILDVELFSRELCLDKVVRSTLVFFLICMSEYSEIVASYFKSGKLKTCLLVHVCEDDGGGMFSRRECYGQGKLTFPKEVDDKKKALFIDDISTAIQRRGLICVDIYDLKAVMDNKQSLGLQVSFAWSELDIVCSQFISANEVTISKSTGVFVCVTAEDSKNTTIEQIDRIFSNFNQTVSSECRFFVSLNLDSAATVECRLSVIVNI